jgi:ABC-type nitrate/sulfonate/bicarbonate transport system substrate-binding protein
LPEVFTISRSLIEADLDLAATIVAYSVAAGEWARTHEDEAIRFVAAEQSVAEATVLQAYGTKVAQQLDIDLSDLRVNALKNRKEFLLSHGFIDTDVDIDNWIDRRPLERAHELLANGSLALPSALLRTPFEQTAAVA